MSELQKIIYNGQVAAIVLAEQAIIPDGLAETDEYTVKAMCLSRWRSPPASNPAPTPTSGRSSTPAARRWRRRNERQPGKRRAPRSRPRSHRCGGAHCGA